MSEPPIDLRGATGLEDPTYQAATMLADAWGPALNRSYRIGFENGRATGRAEAEREMAEAWRAAAKGVRAVLAQPTRDEMAVLRGEAA